MSGLVPKTRVSWALVVVSLDGVKSLHLIKKSYRGVLGYYSKSARKVTDKIGFGQVVSCQAGIRKEKDVAVDYLEFRNNMQQVANWKLEEFEPTLEGGEFGRRLQMLRSNPQQLCIYLNHLIRSVSWNLHNPRLHSHLGEATEESIYILSKEEKVEVEKLVEITDAESIVVKTLGVGKENAKDKSGIKVTAKEQTQEKTKSKKEDIVNSKSGLEANFQKGILGFDQIDVDKITVHKGIIDEKLDKTKIQNLKLLLISQFDPKLSVITVAPAVKNAAEYDQTKLDLNYRVLEGRYVFTAMKELYTEGKTFKSLDLGKVMCVVLNNPGVIAANYANMRQRHLSDQYTSHINIQDFVKLFKRIHDAIKDRNQAIDIVKNSMLTFNFHKDDVTAVSRISKWSEPNLVMIIEVFDYFENFQSLDSENKKTSHLMKSGKKLPVPKLTFHRLAKIEEDKFQEMAQQVITRDISLGDVATWSFNLNKLAEVKQQSLEIAQEVLGEGSQYETFEDLEGDFPSKFVDEKLVEFSKSVKGNGFKTGDRMRLENYVYQVVKDDEHHGSSGTIEFVEMDSVSSSFFQDASCVVLNSKHLSGQCVEYFVEKVSKTTSSLLIVCKSQSEYHQAIEIIQALEDKHDETKLLSLIVKDPSIQSNEEKDVSSCNLVYVVLKGKFVIKNPPLKLMYEGLSVCLKDVVQQITPQAGKVYSVNYMGSSICVIPPQQDVSYTYFGSEDELKRVKHLIAKRKFVAQIPMENLSVDDS